MSIEIKEGRYYRDRMGQVHGPMIRSLLADWPWTTKHKVYAWTATGNFYLDGSEASMDLIQEVQIVPVRETEGDA